MTSDDRSLVARERTSDGAPAGALILIHGRGADEDDLFPLFDLLDPAQRLLGISPRGPFGPPPGARWYLPAPIGFPHAESFLESNGILASWLDARLAEAGIPWDRTVIGGFSQGAVMAFSIGLATGRPSPAGIIGLSGFLPSVPGFQLDLADRMGLPVAIGHGTFDPVIEVAHGRHATATLDAAGLEVTYQEAPLDHTIEPRFLTVLADWLAKLIPQRERPAGRPHPWGGRFPGGEGIL